MPSLVDSSSLAKVLVRASPDLGDSMGAHFGLTTREPSGALVVGYGYGEWLVLASSDSAGDVVHRFEGRPYDGLRSVIDVTHGYAVLRLTGTDAAELLSRLCPIDLSDDVTPTGAVFRSVVGGLSVGVIRDDEAGEPSYLLVVDRSYGQSLSDMLGDAGGEFALAYVRPPLPGM
ncbi:MAG: sarcosine oxidase subunit gamma [Geodermatophilaceae bacterium]